MPTGVRSGVASQPLGGDHTESDQEGKEQKLLHAVSLLVTKVRLRV